MADTIGWIVGAVLLLGVGVPWILWLVWQMVGVVLAAVLPERSLPRHVRRRLEDERRDRVWRSIG